MSSGAVSNGGGGASRGGAIRVAASVAAIGVVSLMVWYRAKNNKRRERRAERKKKQQEQQEAAAAAAAASLAGSSKRSSRNRPPTKTIIINTGGPAALDGLFEEAARKSHQVKNLLNGDKLLLYGLYKQATVGDATLNQPEPSHFHIVAHAKYHAWKRFAGMRPLEAKMNYIQAVQELEMGATRSTASSTSELSFDDDEDDDDLDAAFGGAVGLGLKPSTLAAAQDDSDEDDEDDEDTHDMSPESQLRRAARKGDASRIEKVMRAFPQLNPNASDESGQTALHFCADQGSVQAVQVLLNFGADANSADDDGITVLQVAVISDHVAVAKLLLAAGAMPDQMDCDGDSPRSCVDESNCLAMKQLFQELPFEGTA